jgi:hypothetical protein
MLTSARAQGAPSPCVCAGGSIFRPSPLGRAPLCPGIRVASHSHTHVGMTATMRVPLRKVCRTLTPNTHTHIYTCTCVCTYARC